MPLIDCALEHSLAALLYASFPDREDGDIPEAAHRRLEEIYYRTKFANAAAHRLLAELVDAFAAQREQMLVLKGAALALYLYPDPALRPFGDLDLLIPRARIEQTYAILEQQGLTEGLEREHRFAVEFLKGQTFVRVAAPRVMVDLHWHLLAPTYFRRTVPVEWFWQETTAFSCHGRMARTFKPEAQLLYLAAHASLHHGGLRLIQLYDVGRLLAAARDELDWERVVTCAARFELAPAVAFTLQQSIKWWDAPVPPDALAALERTKPRRATRAVFALASAPQNAARSLADAFYQPGVKSKFKFALGFALPSSEYMRVRYGLHRRAQLPIYYVRRCVAISRQLAQSLAVAANRHIRR
jgi:hypothetical protein